MRKPVQTDLSVCKMICSYAVISGDIDVSPATEIRKSRGLPVKRREALTEEQEAIVKRVSAERKAHFWLFGCLLLYTGMRRGEALALTYGDIDRKAGVIHVTKKLSYATGRCRCWRTTSKARTAGGTSPCFRPWLRRCRETGGADLPGEDGGLCAPRKSQKTGGGTAETRVFSLQSGPATAKPWRRSTLLRIVSGTLWPRSAMRLDWTPGRRPGFWGMRWRLWEGVYTHLRQQRQKSAAEILAEYCK